MTQQTIFATAAPAAGGEAILEGLDRSILSRDPRAANYAGDYVYRGLVGGLYQFQHVETGKFLRFKPTGVIAGGKQGGEI